jgi:hypothetical protein
MNKETYYFPHDYHARHDHKISAMVNDYGIEGYGMYWVLVEFLYESRDNKIEKFPKLFFGLATELAVSPDRAEQFVLALIKDYRLLVEDETHIWSEAVLRRIEIRETKRLMKKQAGHIGGIRSGLTRRNEAERSGASQVEAKESKRKKSKGKEIKDTPASFVYDYYAKTIKPGASVDAIKNIDKLLKAGEKKEDLIARIDAYRKTLKGDDPTFMIQANNFFGLQARYKDYTPIISRLKLADPNCKICKGTGFVFNDSKSANDMCSCKIKK